jgi:hypothetical protein
MMIRKMNLMAAWIPERLCKAVFVLFQDVQSVKFKQLCKWTFCFILSLSLFAAVVSLAIYGSGVDQWFFATTTSACQGDGDFTPFAGNDAWLFSSGFFQINLGMGSPTFAEEKGIDIAWDIVSHRNFYRPPGLHHALTEMD